MEQMHNYFQENLLWVVVQVEQQNQQQLVLQD
jgi:hypothetical protein